MTKLAVFSIAPLTQADRPWVVRILVEHWGSTRVVSRGKIHPADRLPGFVAVAGESAAGFEPGERIGLVTFDIRDQDCEIVSLDSLVEGIGVGSQMIEQVERTARAAGCRRLWLITTNDNTPAIRFYQKRGLRIAAVHVGALDLSRRLKPEIPLLGMDGIPLRDEIEFEKLLD